MARLISITETGRTIESGWCRDTAKMQELYQDFRKSYPLWVHIIETR